MTQTARNEQPKPLATALHTAALAFAIGGFVGPAIAGKPVDWQNLICIPWIGCAAGLHLVGQAVLGKLQ